MRICVGVDYLISLYSFRAYTKKIKNKNRNKNLSHNQMVMGRRILGGHHLKKNKKILSYSTTRNWQNYHQFRRQKCIDKSKSWLHFGERTLFTASPTWPIPKTKTKTISVEEVKRVEYWNLTTLRWLLQVGNRPITTNLPNTDVCDAHSK